MYPSSGMVSDEATSTVTESQNAGLLPPILRLPNEILTEILEFTFQEGSRWKIGRFDTSRACLVCQKFNLVATPLLYRYIHITDLFQPAAKTLKLLRTLKSNPQLGQFCRNFQLDFQPQTDDEDREPLENSVVEFMLVLPRVQHLLIYSMPGLGDFGYKLLEFIFGKLPELKKLEVLASQRRPEGFLSRLIHSMQELRFLRNLRLHGVDGDKHKSFKLPKELVGTGRITTLSTIILNVEIYELAELLKWPAKLEQFEICNHTESPPWDYNMCRNMLLTHRLCLKKLTIGDLFMRGFGLIQLSDFLALEYLSLAAIELDMRDNTPERACDLIFKAPHLRTFYLTFTIHAYRTHKSSILSSDQAKWVQRIGEFSHARNYALREICITHEWYDPVREMEDMLNSTKLESVRDELKSKGIRLEVH